MRNNLKMLLKKKKISIKDFALNFLKLPVNNFTRFLYSKHDKNIENDAVMILSIQKII